MENVRHFGIDKISFERYSVHCVQSSVNVARPLCLFTYHKFSSRIFHVLIVFCFATPCDVFTSHTMFEGNLLQRMSSVSIARRFTAVDFCNVQMPVDTSEFSTLSLSLFFGLLVLNHIDGVLWRNLLLSVDVYIYLYFNSYRGYCSLRPEV